MNGNAMFTHFYLLLDDEPPLGIEPSIFPLGKGCVIRFATGVKIGVGGGTRTHDKVIKSHRFWPLNYTDK